MAADNSIEVLIFGRVHHLKGDDPEHIREVARMVDDNMTRIAAHMQTADGYRAAVLTALQIADRLIEERREMESYRAQVDERSARMLELLDTEPESEEREEAEQRDLPVG